MAQASSRVATRAGVLVALAGLTGEALWMLVADTALALPRRLVEGPDEFVRLPFDVMLVGICSLALLGCAAWFFMVTCLVVLEALAGFTAPTSAASTRWLLGVFSRLSPRVCPLSLRRALLAGCGAALVAGLANGPALAGPRGSTDQTAVSQPATLSGLAVPDRTVGSRQPVAAPVRVRVGDCLWSIAERVLPHHATDAEITSTWQAILHANRSRIGDDPDLIFPGDLLQVPDLHPLHRKESS